MNGMNGRNRGPGRVAILVTTFPGQTSRAEIARQSAVGERPRKDYVELARVLDRVLDGDAGADVIDSEWLTTHGHLLARAIARLPHRSALPAAQIAEVFLRRRRYGAILAWSDRLGLPLALLFKLTRGHRDLVMVSAWASRGKKAVFFRRFKVQTHLRAVVQESSVQLAIAERDLGIPRDRLRLALPAVDDRFWRPQGGSTGNLICSVGWEARDYPTLVRALQGLDLEAALVVGSTVPVAAGALIGEVGGDGPPPNVTLRHGLSFPELRDLYARSRFVVVPLEDVEFNAGITVISEAMAMGKAVIVTRTRGQVDYVRDGEQGLTVPPGDPAALRAAIAYLVAHPEEAERMGRAGRALIEERFGLDAAIARLAALLRGAEVTEQPAGAVSAVVPAEPAALPGRG